jgi:CheY-like chemotaxis protein
MHGCDVARKLGSGSHGPRPRLLIAHTGAGQESDRQAARAAGFDQHLLKPVGPAAILELLK